MEASFSMSIVSSSVRLPRRAAAEAASHPACPPPMTMMSYSECHFLISVLVRCRGACGFSAMTCRADRAVRCGVFRPGVRVRAGGVPRPPGFPAPGLRTMPLHSAAGVRRHAVAARTRDRAVCRFRPPAPDHPGRWYLSSFRCIRRWRGASCPSDRRGAARRAPPRGASPWSAGRRRAGALSATVSTRR